MQNHRPARGWGLDRRLSVGHPSRFRLPSSHTHINQPSETQTTLLSLAERARPCIWLDPHATDRITRPPQNTHRHTPFPAILSHTPSPRIANGRRRHLLRLGRLRQRDHGLQCHGPQVCTSVKWFRFIESIDRWIEGWPFWLNPSTHPHPPQHRLVSPGARPGPDASPRPGRVRE